MPLAHPKCLFDLYNTFCAVHLWEIYVPSLGLWGDGEDARKRQPLVCAVPGKAHSRCTVKLELSLQVLHSGTEVSHPLGLGIQLFSSAANTRLPVGSISQEGDH